jgi:hypothetical protein
MTPLNTLDIALDYLAANPDHYLFPIKAGSKFPPTIKNNLADASNDPKQIEAWYKRWPHCNWGIALRKSRLLVVDVDMGEGKSGRATYDLLTLLYGWPPTMAVRTPSNGLHLYYAGQHIFALGDNGFGLNIDSPNYVLLAGCTVKGKPKGYRLINARTIAEAPTWFYELLGRAKEKRVNAAEAVVECDQPANITWAIDHLRHQAPPAIEGEGGELCTMKVAMTLRDQAISEPLAVELMLEHYNDRCIPPWDVEGLSKKIANGYAYASLSPMGGTTAEADFAHDPIEAVPLSKRKAARLAQQQADLIELRRAREMDKAQNPGWSRRAPFSAENRLRRKLSKQHARHKKVAAFSQPFKKGTHT